MAVESTDLKLFNVLLMVELKDTCPLWVWGSFWQEATRNTKASKIREKE
jgi:hypothetical protein